MRRRTFIAAIAANAAWQTTSRSQATRVPRVAFLSPASGPGPNHAAFLRELKALGFEDGRTLDITWTWLDQRYDLLLDTVDAAVKSNASALVVQTQAVALAAQKATKTIPIIFVGVRDPVSAGLVGSISRPGGNITGATLTPTWELAAKQVELLRDMIPRASRIGVFWNPSVPVQARAIEAIVTATEPLGVTLVQLGVSVPGDIERTFEKLRDVRVDGIITLVDSFTYGQRDLIAKLAISNRVPTIFETREYVEAGGLLSYGIVYQEMYAQGARLLARILKGERVADLPIVEASRFELVINLRTAEKLGLEIPPILIGRADEIFD